MEKWPGAMAMIGGDGDWLSSRRVNDCIHIMGLCLEVPLHHPIFSLIWLSVCSKKIFKPAR